MFDPPVDEDVTLETFYRALRPDDAERIARTWHYALQHRLPTSLAQEPPS
jgi:hypothetical protein